MDGMRVPSLSLDLLRGFRAAARHLSFTQAARELHLTQPAVSREIRTLEDQLGRPLFSRVGRKLELTEAGRDLYGAVDEALAIIDSATARVTGAQQALAVTTTVALASTWLVPRLPRFTRLHPDIDMRLVASNEAVDLEREHVDVAIRYVPAGVATVSHDKLFDYAQFPVCAPSMARDPARPLGHIADLAHHVLLDFETQLYGRPWSDWTQWFAAMGVRRPQAAGWLRFSHYDQVIDAALRGSGIAVGKLPHLRQHLRDGTLVAPLGDDAVAPMGAFFVEVAASTRLAGVACFVDWLHAEARRDARRPRPVATRR
jgi:DNA-binding transcriptional LysR family regulator